MEAWRRAGWNERRAAAHLLDRLTFGPRPGEVERVVAAGLDAWVETQLGRRAPEDDLGPRLAGLRALDLAVEEYPRRFPPLGSVVQEAMDAGVFPRDLDRAALDDPVRREALRAELLAFARARGYRSQRELTAELTAQKTLRAVYAENQLAEVLTDFWFNHFNVAATDTLARPYLLAYERDAIRPHVLGDFRALLGATARHPAMLFYLDNAQSTAGEGDLTTLDWAVAARGAEWERRRARQRGAVRPQRPRGLNENYARELLELHTLGVDGGYSQEDVVEVARAFTGWTTVPPGLDREEAAARIRRARDADLGFVFEEAFVFRADAHDAAAKRVLGVELPAGRGVEDGEQVLDLLAGHPATAEHLAQKLAVRFVDDDPPPALVARLAASFRASGGDLGAVMRTLLAAPEFWDPAARAIKIKSPFELAVSALRALAAEPVSPRGVVEWVERMGQPLYAAPAPTGFPEVGDGWVSAGALLNRMNFALELAAGRIEGVALEVAALVEGPEPESRAAALAAYLPLLLPERDLAETRALLAPMVEAPELAERVAAAAPSEGAVDWLAAEDLDEWLGVGDPASQRRRRQVRQPPPSALEQVVGVILGSPEFQKR